MYAVRVARPPAADYLHKGHAGFIGKPAKKKPQGVLMTRFNTQLVHGLPVNDNNTGAVNPPIYNSSTYAVESVNAMPRWDYARSGNPTRDFLEKQIAQLEHGTRGFAFASGLAAIHAVLSIFKPGDRIVVGKNIYGGTYSLFNEYFAERGLEFDSVDTADYEALDAAISGRDRGGRAASAVYFETLTNPLLQINNVNRISPSRTDTARCPSSTTRSSPRTCSSRSIWARISSSIRPPNTWQAIPR